MTGADEEDNEYNVKRHGLEDDPEYKKLTKEWQAKSEAFLQEQQEIALKHMAKMKLQHEKAAQEALQASTQIETTTINQIEDQT